MKYNFSFWVFIMILLQIIAFNCVAQESTLWLRNGKKITISSYKLDTAGYYDGKITYTTVKGKEKNKYLEDVFSVVEKNGQESVLYTPNLEFGEILTPEQMKQYVIGIGDARSNKISPLIGLGGVCSGIVGAFIPQPQIKVGDGSMPVPVGVLVPATYIAIMGATPPDADKLLQKMPDKANNEHYLMGYQDGIRKKRIKESFMGAGFGFLVGILFITIAN